MACGRPKNLEIAGGNPLCGPHDRRRNFLTTGNGQPAKGKPGATGKGGNPRATRQRETSGHGPRTPRATRQRGKPRSHRQRGKPRSHPAKGKPRSHPAKGETPEPPAKGDLGSRPEDTRSHPAKGEPRALGTRGTRSHRRRGNSPATGAGNPGPPGNRYSEPLARRAWSQPATDVPSLWHGQSGATRQRDTSGPLGWGDPEPPATGESLRSHPARGNPGHSARGGT